MAVSGELQTVGEGSAYAGNGPVAEIDGEAGDRDVRCPNASQATAIAVQGIARGGPMEDEVAVRDLSFGTLFKIVFWAGACVWILLASIAVVLALVAPGSIIVNGVRATSTAEAIGAAPIFLIIGAIFTSIFAVVGSGLLWLVGRFLPLGTINTRD